MTYLQILDLKRMEILNSVRRTLTLAGHRPDGSVALRTHLFTTFLVCYAMDLIYSMFLESTGDIKKILVVKELTSIVMALVLIPGSPGVYKLCQVVEAQMRRNILQPIVPEVAQIRSQLDLEHNKTGKKIYKTLVLIIIVYVSVPVLQSVFIIAIHKIPILSKFKMMIIRNHNNETIMKTLDVEEDLPLVFHFYYPPGLATLWFYFILSSCHAMWCIWICLYLYSIFNSAMMSIKNTISEMKALGVAFERIDEITGQKIDKEKFVENINYPVDNINNQANKILLKDYFRLIVIQHQLVCRDLRSIDQGLKTVIVALDVAFGLHMCLAIYCIIKMESFSLKIDYTVLLFWLMTIVYNYSAIGQQITNEGDALTMKIYDSAWIDKPQSIKKSLLLVLTRATRRMELKPYGIYVLNLTSFKNVSWFIFHPKFIYKL
ncbi:uncharacterized protein LOC120351991 [Nilaparvata lugens]|uniref:uncharacterized protein LOC120351991 n=1 Tax=Nilaparvata lugens TaxID=108931 RepID=UPI00193E3B7E|nr:uncharacterized protein LOC120351991 [Nilaparvata lugens]